MVCMVTTSVICFPLHGEILMQCRSEIMHALAAFYENDCITCDRSNSLTVQPCMIDQ